MKKLTLLNFFTIVLLVITTSLAYATRDIIEDMTSGPVCSGTDIILNDYDMDGDMVADLDVVIGISNGKVEIETDMVTGNKRIKITTGSGDCLNDFPGQITINFRNTADTDYRPVNFVSLITIRNSAGTTVSVEGTTNIAPGTFPASNTVNLDLTVSRHQFINKNVITIPITFTPTSAVTEYVNYVDDLIISDDTIPAVINVLDRSGSMNTTIGMSTRIAEARTALIGVTSLIDGLADEIEYGLVVYPEQPWSGSCAAQTILPLDLYESFHVDPPAGPLDEITDSINNQNASGNTPMLLAIDMAISQFTDQPFTTIVLLSDGYHNCPFPVNITDAEMTSRIDALNDKNITVNTIGFGSSADPDLNLLAELADTTGGYFYDATHSDIDPVPITVPGLSTAYDKIVTEGLGLQHATDPVDIIKKNETKTYDIIINPLDEKICFYISHNTNQPDYLGIKIFSSDGIILPDSMLEVKKIVNPRSNIISIDQSFLRLPGKVDENSWKLTINADNIEGDQEVFQYSVICKSVLHMNTWFNQRSYLTGDTMKIYLQVTENNNILKPDVTAIKANTPEDGMGNWLAQNKASADRISAIQKKQEVDKLVFAQAKALVLQEMQIEIPGKDTTKNISFNDDGTNGDQVAGDGIYTAIYGQVKKEGTYKFNIQASGDLTKEGKGKYNRETEIQKYVNVRVEPVDFVKKVIPVKKLLTRQSRLKSAKTDTSRGNLFNVALSLKDKFGNIPYPTALRKIKLSVDTGQVLGNIEPQPDGSLIQQIMLPENIKPGDVTMTMVSVDKSTGEDTLKTMPDRWIIYLIIIVLIIIIMIIRRRK